MKESKEARTERQFRELWLFIEVLRKAGNAVEEEVRFDMRPSDSTAEPPIPRKWRIDVALPLVHTDHPGGGYPHRRSESIAIEIEGYGRHQSMVGFNSDLDKYLELFAQGWTLLRVSRKMIADGRALDALARRGVRVEKSVD